MEFGVDLGGDFGGLDLGATTPEDVGVADGDAFGGEVFVDGGFVLHDFGFLGAVHDAHDVDVAELGTAFAPIGVGHAVMAAHFGSGLLLHAFGDGPVEEAVEAGDLFAGVGWFDVFEEGGEASDDFLGVEGLGDFAKAIEGGFGDFGAFGPAIGDDFVGGEFFFEREEDFPLFVSEFDGGSGHHFGRGVDFGSGLEAFAAGVADAEGEDAVGRHEDVFFGADDVLEDGGVVVEGLALGDF